MKLIKRCYGCGKSLYPWQDTVRTKLVGRIHRLCAFTANVKYYCNKTITEVIEYNNKAALEELNKEEVKRKIKEKK